MLRIIHVLKALVFSFFLKIKYRSRIKLGGVIRVEGKVKVSISRGACLVINGPISIKGQTQILIREGAYCEIGKRTFINRNCSIVCRESIIVGDSVLFGESVKVYDNDHKIINSVVSNGEFNTAPIVIGDNAWIANDVNVLKGSKIPSSTVIGAMSLVNKPLEKCGVYVGIPVRLIKLLKK